MPTARTDSTAFSTKRISRRPEGEDVLRDIRVGFVLHPVDLQALKRAWLEALDSVEPFVVSRPPEEIGCLYYSVSRQEFLDPRVVTDSVPRFGRPGGVLPRIVE